MHRLLVCLFVVLPCVAHAQVEVVIAQEVKEVALKVHVKRQATLKFDAPIESWMYHRWGDRNLYAEKGPEDTITLRPGREIDGPWGH